MMDISKLANADDTIVTCARTLRTLHYINPINEEEQREAFIKRKIRTPQFFYRDLRYNQQDILALLNSIEVPDDKFGHIYLGKRREMLLENRVLVNRGNKEIVRVATKELYGSPDKDTLAYADELIKNVNTTEQTRNLSSEDVREAFKDYLIQKGLEDWRVKFSDKRQTTVYPQEKKITICRNRLFTNNEANRLKVHEIDVHALRASNGYEQPLKIFALGLPGFISTEEGLATYFEEQTNNLSQQTILGYAGRVIAVDTVCRDLDFNSTFDILKSKKFTDIQAWNLAIRAHRAGGYIKDHVYLQGYKKIREFAETNGDFKTLYIGKIGTEDIQLASQLLHSGVLKKAKHIPDFIK
jgi:uncharacterized protein (TIGR02421 family)